ncbi:protein FAM8A1-like [Daphnia pulicaria]|uniref:protein FAM8A1-like n=1 Tax=Daphnia pulicaria TaxID=35523 RepID=UPI001EEB29BC|nr:protein FAM8A1-like [Daphnia pulicaria]
MNSGVNVSEDSAGELRRMGEYADQLRSWLGQAYQWQTLQCLPYSMPSVFMQSRHRPLSNSTPVSATTETPVTNVNHQQRPSTRIGSVLATPPIEGRVFEVPKLSKRLLAEVIDFGLLFFIKAFVTLTVLDAWNMEDSGFFQTEEKEITEEADYEMAMAITANLLTIELIHRLLVVLYEVCFTLQGGTPGKRTMGLSIISCTKCIPVGENRVLVQPATKVTFWRSLGRAFLKNMGTAILFPTFLPLMVVQHNRTLYDILCGTVVVESE